MVAKFDVSLPMLAQPTNHLMWLANGWQMVGKWSGSQCCITNLMPTLCQIWKSDNELIFSQNCWWMVIKGLAIANNMWANIGILIISCSSSKVIGKWFEIGQIANDYCKFEVGNVYKFRAH